MEHPYRDFEDLEGWQSIKKAIDELILNNDIELLTDDKYVIGYIYRVLKDDKVNFCITSSTN